MTESVDESTRSGGFRRFFLRGLALVLPAILTVFILVKTYQLIDRHLIQYVNMGIHQLLEAHTDFYLVFEETAYENWWLQNLVILPTYWFFQYVLGFIVSILFVCGAGVLMTNFVGRRVWHALESRLMRFPVIRFIYPFIKQVTDFLFSERKVAYRAVVAVEYPRKGIWSLGLVTGRGFEEISRRTGKTLVSIFIPNSPTPVTGYVIFVSQDEVMPLDITVDEALRLTVSGGVIAPGAKTKALNAEGPSTQQAGVDGGEEEQDRPKGSVSGSSPNKPENS